MGWKQNVMLAIAFVVIGTILLLIFVPDEQVDPIPALQQPIYIITCGNF